MVSFNTLYLDVFQQPVDRFGVAQKEVEGVSQARHESASTWDAAVQIWNDHCKTEHKHDTTRPPPQEPTSPSPPRRVTLLTAAAPPPASRETRRPETQASAAHGQKPPCSRTSIVRPSTPLPSGPTPVATPNSSPTKRLKFYAVSGSPVVYTDRFDPLLFPISLLTSRNCRAEAVAAVRALDGARMMVHDDLEKVEEFLDAEGARGNWADGDF